MFAFEALTRPFAWARSVAAALSATGR
jgi:hypothetical protein